MSVKSRLRIISVSMLSLFCPIEDRRSPLNLSNFKKLRSSEAFDTIMHAQIDALKWQFRRLETSETFSDDKSLYVVSSAG